ncbi:uncharacterized protein LAESUDRAFT_724035 [Laetiporus sulphureus 93-53]|uniref:Uncharacterized protein n=1 Tax=Laetiporus sulphureus 93-53 TaxID=1314785 RepID=A0A165EZL7_9APHY|nr:uncharacterized protein LAESUDRAFT_724035 [Laetiporus sulphureus 93-53]KZT08052.1 hypothetical protein LAESUDRAFT_724035 [Laetiporus sulphureus 93-53]
MSHAAADVDNDPGTSVSTVRGLQGLQRLNTVMPPDLTVSLDIGGGRQLSPRQPLLHSPLPSPGSPSGDSVSSLPSVSSSFLYSSGPGSPPHAPSHTNDTHQSTDTDAEPHDSTQGLIIPSLALPILTQRPTPYGQTLGDVRLLILAPRHAASSVSTLVSQLIDENDDIVDEGAWEEEDRGHFAGRIAVRRASTTWVELRDAHGLEHTEPARNIELVRVPGYDAEDAAETILGRTLPLVHAPFHQVLEALNPEYGPSTVLANLLSSACTPLYTALILLLTSSAPTQTERNLLDALSPHVPVVVLPPLASESSYPFYSSGYSSYPISIASSAYASPQHPAGSHSPITSAPISAFRPTSAHALRLGLFRTPETIAHLRGESAARFLRWREVERAVNRISSSSGDYFSKMPSTSTSLETRAGYTPCVPKFPSAAKSKHGWDKARWEAEWEGTLSHDVAEGLRQRGHANTARPSEDQLREQEPAFDEYRSPQGCVPSPLDPLHVGSLFMFSLSLLGPLRARLAQSFGFGGRASTNTMDTERSGEKRRSRTLGLGLEMALMGAFCAGVGLGLLLVRG